jgi:hypothetical protein
MPVSVEWDNPEKTIIYARYERWSWNEFYKALENCTELSHTVDHQVYIICDLVDNLVPKGGTITHATAAMKQDNVRVNLILLVTPNRFIQALTQMSQRIVPGFQNKYRMVPTLEAAREMIAKDSQKRATTSP